MKNTVQK